MNRFVRVYVSQVIGDAIDALRKAGLQIDYVPSETGTETSGHLPRNSGTVSNVDSWRKSISTEFMRDIPESAMTGFEIIDDHSLCPYMLRKITETLNVVQWPDEYILEQLPTTEPAPTMQDVCSFASLVNFKIQLYGATAEAQSTYLFRMRELGATIAEEFGVLLQEAEKISSSASLLPRAAEKFLALEAWVNSGCRAEKK